MHQWVTTSLPKGGRLRDCQHGTIAASRPHLGIAKSRIYDAKSRRTYPYPPSPVRIAPMSSRMLLAAQLGGVSGTGARCAHGDRLTTQRGAFVVCMITFTRNPPTTGSAPTAPAADGSHPTPTAAAPAASNATGSEFSAP